MAVSTTDTKAASTEVSRAIPAGIRCVICVASFDLEAKLQTAIAQLPGIIVVGCANDWGRCLLLVDDYCPELLVIEEEMLPSCEMGWDWPLILKVTSDNRDPQDAQVVCAHSCSENLRYVFRQMQARIVEKKSLELRELLSNYMEATGKRYRNVFEVSDLDKLRVVNVEDVVFISVEGNYAVLNTRAGVFRFRETLNNLAESLDPDRFARIHRSAIVNLNLVERLVDGTDGAALLLQDGTRLPIGPTFKGLDGLPMSKNGH